MSKTGIPKKLKKRLMRILSAAIAFVAVYIPFEICGENANNNLFLILFLAVYFLIGGDIIRKACSNIAHGQIFDENFLMLIATVGAFVVGEYPEAVAVMLFYQVGEWFQSYAVNRSRRSIKDLMNIRPDYANVIRDDEELNVSPEDVSIDEVIIVKPGEKVPLDGVVIEGSSTLDTMALTGESMPREISVSEEIISGCVNLNGVLKIRVTKEFAQSTVSKILNLVENATSKKAQSENFITKFAKYYTPIVVISAVLLAFIPPFILQQPFSPWIYRALTFLVISCPCALVISVPLSFFGGIGGAGKAGILVKGSTYLELLSKAEMVVMDKTGTLTKGIFKVMEIVPVDDSISKEELLAKTAIAESYSNHPISISLQKAYGKEIDKTRLGTIEETAGHGITALVDGIQLYIGNQKLMSSINITIPDVTQIGTVVYVAEKEKLLGYIVIADEEKDDAALAIRLMKQCGVKKTVMLTGDRKETAKYMAEKLGLDEYYSELLPGDKVDKMEKLFSEKSDNGKIVFVGDGINDAPVLARADIGVAMGGLGSDAAIEAADVVIMTDEPSKIAKAIQISNKTLKIVHQNIAFALGVKVLVLILAALGMASMWAAVFADVGVAFLAILNAMRAMKVPGTLK